MVDPTNDRVQRFVANVRGTTIGEDLVEHDAVVGRISVADHIIVVVHW